MVAKIASSIKRKTINCHGSNSAVASANVIFIRIEVFKDAAHSLLVFI